MRAAVIENGVVVNVIIVDNIEGPNVVATETANIGDLYDGQAFTRPQAA